MNPYLVIIIFLLIGHFLLETIADILNLRSVTEELPPDFRGWYDNDKYQKSQKYLRDNTQFAIIVDSFNLIISLVFIFTGGFNFIDKIAINFGFGSICTGLIFAGILLLGIKIIGLPFSLYSTFVIEEKYGFNKTTPKTFLFDLVKALGLTVIIGGLVFALVLWFFKKAGNMAWLYCWIATTGFQIFLIFIAPYVIMPLFNKFIPLEEEDELKSAIKDYAESQDFKIKGVYKMDGSKRSTKTNAFFTGFGKSRRIVLFDTLIEKHPVSELVSIVGHEMGHYKKKHILKAIIRSFITAGLMFFLLSLFIGNKQLFEAFKMDHISIYAGLFFFGFLYMPLGTIFSIIENFISRKQEYDADSFAVKTCSESEAMINCLKRLSVDNLSNLTPHSLKVFLDYSHPPVIDRIKAIQSISNSS